VEGAASLREQLPLSGVRVVKVSEERGRPAGTREAPVVAPVMTLKEGVR